MSQSEFDSFLDSAFKKIEVHLSTEQIRQFEVYHDQLLLWNKKSNLLSRRDESRIVERHFVESAALCRFNVLLEAASVLDLGAGAGFPGVPLKVVLPQLKLSLLDSNRMKTLFLKDVIKHLKLLDVEVICERAENVALRHVYRHKFDVVVTRAVASLEKLYGWAADFLRPGGHLVAMKGPDIRKELSALEQQHGHLEFKLEKLRLPETTGQIRESTVIFVQKQNESPIRSDIT